MHPFAWELEIEWKRSFRNRKKWECYCSWNFPYTQRDIT